MVSFLVLAGFYVPRFASDGSPLDAVLRLVVVHGLLSLSQEGVHALIGTQEPIHAHDGFEGQDAVGVGGGRDMSERSASVAAGRREGFKEERRLSPFHEVDHVDDARRADHWLVGEDGPHGLFHAELRLQGRQERLDFLPEYRRKNKLTEEKKVAPQKYKITVDTGTNFNRLKIREQLNEAMLQLLLQIKHFIPEEIKRHKKKKPCAQGRLSIWCVHSPYPAAFEHSRVN